jgi:hypothetical protein
MEIDPYSGQSKVRLFSLSILTDKIVLVVQSPEVPSPPPISWDDYHRLPNHQWWVQTLNPNCHCHCDRNACPSRILISLVINACDSMRSFLFKSLLRTTRTHKLQLLPNKPTMNMTDFPTPGCFEIATEQ